MARQTSIQSLIHHVKYTISAAIIAAIAAATCVTLQLPIWAMFIGWVAFFTRGLKSHIITNLVCVWIGITIGMIAGLALSLIGPSLGAGALPLIVFIVAVLVLSMRSVPPINNSLCYFLGLISFFASNYTPSIEHFLVLSGATTVGSLGGLASLFVQNSILNKAKKSSSFYLNR